ncbi:MFS transporter [Bacillus sp. AFS094611]|uniref:MFS transporter n=2 Tax=Bacillaceae TaxID=186817 RepID=A0A2A7D277_BACAN|nr:MULTISPECIES: MFS transporter [unclassified Bacillus (in: firmicutes)]MDC7973063.1 MFS transporter [Bacillus sp. BLCC-B18]PDZ14123.1 MFS transporter [Bacillus anthracis]PDZ48338.1 MFS transporter [Bacillus sp. AFS094611]
MDHKSNISSFPILLLMCLGIFICLLDTTIMNIALPAIQKDLNTTLETSSWMLNTYTMTIAVLSIPMGRLAEIYGKMKFFIIGLIIFAGGSALCGFSESGDMLIFARFCQSIGAAILVPVATIIGIESLPLNKRHISLSLLGATQGLSTALGPSIGGLIAQNLGWSWVFFVNIPICMVTLVIAFIILPFKKDIRVQAKLDWAGLILSAIGIFSLNLVLIKGNAWGWTSFVSLLCFLIFVITLITFIIVEKNSQNPMVNLNLFKDRLYVGATLAVSTGYLFLVGVMVLLPQFLTNFQEKTELQAALLITPISVTIFIVVNFVGFLVKKIGYVIPIIIGYLAVATSYFQLAHLNTSSTVSEIIVIGITLGVGFSFIISPATMASVSSFEGEMLTASQSVFTMLRQIGVVLAVAIFVSSITHEVESKKQNVISYAKEQTQDINVSPEKRLEIIENTKVRISSESTFGKVIEQPKVSVSERQDLIDKNVENSLSHYPSAAQEKVKKQITDQVTKQVDQEILIINRELKNYTDNVISYTRDEFSSIFSTVFSHALPYIFISILISIFYRKNKKLKINRIKEGTDLGE